MLINLKRQAAVWIAVVLWMPAVGFGMWTLWNYASAAGAPASAPREWPADPLVTAVPGRANLIVFAHPRCACTTASIGELALIMARGQGHVNAEVLFYSPAGMNADWTKTPLWRSALEIPGVRAIEDREGACARRFGVSVSGQTLLYDAAGHLVFYGGITALRGHSGDNEGRDSIGAILEGRGPRRTTTPVFGCGLFAEE